MTVPFWKQSDTTAGKLTEADVRHMMAYVRAEPARRCPHVVTSSYAATLRVRGHETTHCPWCGTLVRV